MNKDIEETIETLINEFYFESKPRCGAELEDIRDYMEKLQEENEILKRDKEALQNNYNEMFNMSNSRIDKAIEYIKDDSLFNGSGICANDLLDILRGEE